jgi:hypothetical protein
MTLLNGNQTMILMTALLEQWEKRKINGKQFRIYHRIYPMMMELATNYNVECKVGLPVLNGLLK